MDSAFLLLSRFCVQLLFNFPHTPANPTGPTPRSSIVAGYWVNSWEEACPSLLLYKFCSVLTHNSSEGDGLRNRIPAQTVCSMNAARPLACGKQPGNGLAVF